MLCTIDCDRQIGIIGNWYFSINDALISPVALTPDTSHAIYSMDRQLGTKIMQEHRPVLNFTYYYLPLVDQLIMFF